MTKGLLGGLLRRLHPLLGYRFDSVADFLGGAPVIEISGRRHPVEIEYQPGSWS